MNKPIKKQAKDLNTHLTKEDINMTKKHMKICSIICVTREMQIKTIMRYPSTAVRIVKFKTLTASNADEDVKQQELINCYRNAKWYTHFESLVGSYKTKYTLTV